MITLEAIDGRDCETAFIRSGRDPAHLAGFLKKYPAAFHLSWVKTALAEWGATGNSDNYRLLQRGRGERIDSGLIQVFIDFKIFENVDRMVRQGLPLTTGKVDQLRGKFGIFQIVANRTKFNGIYLSSARIKERYYRFLRHEAALIIDDNRTAIIGPTRVELLTPIGRIKAVGFLRLNPKDGFKRVA